MLGQTESLGLGKASFSKSRRGKLGGSVAAKGFRKSGKPWVLSSGTSRKKLWPVSGSTAPSRERLSKR
jgi:hypothetical protein